MTPLQLLSTLLLLFGLTIANQSHGQQRRRIEIVQANSMRNLLLDGVEIRRLIGNVVIAHEGVVMASDSAYEYAGTNRFDAFGNVVITHGESRLYGDTLRYDGNTGVARMRGQAVRLVDSHGTLTTQHLDYWIAPREAHFFNGGVLSDQDNRLSSRQGIYYTQERRALFIGGVVLENDDGLVNTDTLEYFTNTQWANFYGPTRFFHGEDYMFGEQGWYSRLDEQVNLTRNAFVERESYRMVAQNIFYDNRQGFARATGNVVIIDTVNRVTLFGQTATFFRANQRFDLMDSPLALMVSEQGDSLFLRADTLRSQAYPIPTAATQEPPPADTLFRRVRGIGSVRFFRHDFQGVADSMLFSTLDSTLSLFVQPVLWNEQHQIYARRMKAFFRDDAIHRVELRETGFLGSQEDTTHFNQITGRDLDILFHKGQLHQLNVNNSAQMVYFIRDQGQITALNRAEGNGISIQVRENQVTTVTFIGRPISTILPIQGAQIEDLIIPGFKWEAGRRPSSAHDIIPQGLEISAHKKAIDKALGYKNKPSQLPKP